jgi:hypothetical protein
MMPGPQRQPSDDLPWPIEACNKRILMEASNMYLTGWTFGKYAMLLIGIGELRELRKPHLDECRQIAALIDGLTD